MVSHRRAGLVTSCLLLQACSSLPDSPEPREQVGVEVVLHWRKATVLEVEALVTERLERALQESPGLLGLESTSVEAAAALTALFEPSEEDPTGLDRVRQAVDSMDEDLPQEVERPLELRRANRAQRKLLEAVLASERGIEVLARQAEELEQAFTEVAGVEEVRMIGARPDQLQLELDHQRMSRKGIRLPEVLQLLNASLHSRSEGDPGPPRLSRILLSPLRGRSSAKLADIVKTSVVRPDRASRVTLDSQPAILVTVFHQAEAQPDDVLQELTTVLREQQERWPSSTTSQLLDSATARISTELWLDERDDGEELIGRLGRVGEALGAEHLLLEQGLPLHPALPQKVEPRHWRMALIWQDAIPSGAQALLDGQLQVIPGIQLGQVEPAADQFFLDVFADEPERLSEASDRLCAAARAVSGVRRAHDDLPEPAPRVELELDSLELSRHDISRASVDLALWVHTDGLLLGSVVHKDQVRPLRLRVRTDAPLERIPLQSPTSGQEVRLGELGSVARVPQPDAIHHVDGARAATIVITAAEDRLRQRRLLDALEDVELPDQTSWTLGPASIR